MQNKETQENRTTILEGVVAGHALKFVRGTTRPLFGSGGDEINLVPKLMCSVLVELYDGQHRVPVNVKSCEKPLPRGTERDDVPTEQKVQTYLLLEKQFPIASPVKVRRFQNDSGKDRFQLLGK